MPKHTFRFPPQVGDAIKRHVRNAIEAVEPARYSQEANYTAALINRLEGIAYEGEHGIVKFRSTVFDDRGPDSAESRFGADFAITATISNGTITIQKVILVQAKLGRLSDMSISETKFLKSQLGKMRRLVGAPKVMEIPEHSGCRFPAIISGINILTDQPYTSMDLPDYFVARVTTTLDGCTDPKIVEVVQESSLSRVDVTGKLFL
jgi:hypothetical protein